MGCDFDFFNETTNVYAQKNSGDEHVWLWKNINRGSVHHLINVIRTIIKLNDWKYTDSIYVKCCCERFTYQNNILFDNNYDETLDDDGKCSSELCPICIQK